MIDKLEWKWPTTQGYAIRGKNVSVDNEYPVAQYPHLHALMRTLEKNPEILRGN